MYEPLTPDVIARIRRAVGDDAVVETAEKREPYGRDSTDNLRLPELVVVAATTEQVQALLRLANRHRFAVTPRGLGTGRAGGAVPLFGGVVLSLERMNRIVGVYPADMIAVVEPGCLTRDLKEEVRRHGLFYPPDPASLDTCSVGGNAATNAGGPSCIKYGTTRDYILGLEVVLPSGELLATGVRTRKGVVGYDLTRLIVGSEGTLAVITRLTVKLVPHPPAVTSLVALFADLGAAMDAIHAIHTAGHVPCAMEFMDARCLRTVGDLLPFPGAAAAGAFLLVEVDGMPEVIAREIEQVGEVCLAAGAEEVLMAPDAARRARLWEVRRQVSLRMDERFPSLIREDIAVPLGAIAAFCRAFPRLEREHGVEITAYGHAGDGNIHLLVTGAEGRREEAVRAILTDVVARGGTISGEHGIGMDKKRFLPLELPAESIRLQREIKRLFDPRHVLNPGKIFP